MIYMQTVDSPGGQWTRPSSSAPPPIIAASVGSSVPHNHRAEGPKSVSFQLHQQLSQAEGQCPV